MKPLGIKAKVVLATSVTSILMIGIVTVVQMQRMCDDFTTVLFAQQNALINRTAQDLDDKLGLLLDVLALSARTTPLAVTGSADKLRAHFGDRVLLAMFDDLLVLDRDGQVVADLPQQPGRTLVNAADRAYFQRVMRERKPFITEPLIGRGNKQPIVQMVAPVLDAKGEVACVLVGVLRLYKDSLLGHLRTAKVGKSGYYFALTRTAVPVYVLHPDPKRLLQPRPANANPATSEALNQGFEGTTISTNSTNSSQLRALVSYKMLKSVDWMLAASLPVEEAFEPFDGLLSRLALWSFLAALLTAALIGWLTSNLLAPLVRLRDAIVRLRADASSYVPLLVRTQDEVGQLTMAFNSLIHERLATDARLQGLIEFAPNAIVVIDGDGRIETFNRQAEVYFGYARSEILGQPLETLVPERLRARHVVHRQRFFSTRLSAEPVRMGRDATLWGLRKDGSEFPLEINLSAVRTDQGTKTLSMISDITERHRLQLEVAARALELERDRDRAEAANRAKSDFVANMSHEIRTPMNAVLGMVHLLGNTALTSEQRKYLAMVRVSGQSLMGILNDVLDFSKIEARRMELAPVEFVLDETMDALATTMTMNAGDKELELAIDVDPAAPRRLRGDALRLQQILVNLAGNAIKFTEQGEVLVSVKLSARQGQRALLRFEVRDTGIGIPLEQQAQLFTAFSQGDESIIRRFGGTGLGLAITKHLVELMGGQIAVSSPPGEGTRFWFTLPFEVVAEQAGPRRKPDIGPLKLLVVDDNRTSRELIARLIRAWGWSADEAASGEAAVALVGAQLARAQRYDAVLADWHMPGMDGLATAKALRRAAAGARQPIVVMVNAFARGDLAAISAAPEADAVLVKPITSSNLFDALHQALATHDGRDEAHLVEQGGAPDRLRGAHLLLVEDNLLNQAVARGILEHAGATLDVVGDGQQAVDLLRVDAGRYDLVLMDMQMPVLDGFSATRILRQELGLALPVVAMTAAVLTAERERCVEAGISDFIPKPIEVEEMLAVILRHLPEVARRGGTQRTMRAAADADRAPTEAMPAAGAAPTPAPIPMPVPLHAAVAAPMPVSAPVSAPVPPAVSASTADTVFNMDSLMRVMGKDPKGRTVMFKLVRGALGGGLEPVDQADLALREGRPQDAGRLLHSLRGAVGVLGAKRLIQATLDAESAIHEGRADQLEAQLVNVRRVLEQTLDEARVWLEQEDR
ncbi:response regulator [Rugamonas sp. CCM 8940]|uniref:response regulator n=1 Tax=Rugamonas sp. CCM 8940 TaxID=2765359 RepID=UPI0018F4B38D|nr:response regulator [Rugamonas sp. CCM 8940]MBJ7309602.1 response regulator [Rugamonas sp. CCM 8940]